MMRYSKTSLIRTHLIRTQASRLRSGRRRRHRQPRPRRHRQPRRGVGTVSAPRVAASGQQAPRVQVCAEGVELLSCAVEFGFRFGLRVIPSGSPVPASAPSAPRRATGTVSLVAASGRQAPRVQVWAEGVELLSLCAVEFTLGFYSEWRGQKLFSWRRPDFAGRR